MNNFISMTFPINTTLLRALSLRFDKSHEVEI